MSRAAGGLRIAFFGSSLVSAYWNGAATYYRGILKALHRLGHRITFYEPDAYGRQEHRDIEAPDYARSVVYPADEAGVRAALREAAEADVVVKASGVGVFDELLEGEVLELAGGSRRAVFWDVDAPATLERVHTRREDPFRERIPRYDLILTYGGGQPVASAYRLLGARRCVPIYNALDPDDHHPEERDPRFEGSLGFLGNRLPDREARVEEFFFKAARLLPERSFLLGGSGWQGPIPGLPNVRVLGHVYTRDHNRFNSSVDLVLNISRESMARFGWSPATRFFEAAGAGACIVTDAWAGVEQFLRPGSECLVARSGGEVAGWVRSVGAGEAARIGRAARARVRAEHTYQHRAQQVEPLLLALFSPGSETGGSGRGNPGGGNPGGDPGRAGRRQ